MVMSEIMALKFLNFLQSGNIQQRLALLFGICQDKLFAYPKPCHFAKKNEFHNFSSYIVPVHFFWLSVQLRVLGARKKLTVVI